MSSLPRLWNPYERVAGVYRLWHGEFAYVGSSVNIGGRKADHLRHLRNGTHHNLKLQRLADSVGVEALRFDVITEVEADKGIRFLRNTEQGYIDREVVIRGRDRLLNATLDVNYRPRR